MNFDKLLLKSSIGAAFVLIATAAVYAQPEPVEAPYGVWLDHTGRGAVEITDCDGNLCGEVVWTKDPEKAAKGCGLKILGNVKPVGANVWDGGWIYSPERKRKFDVEIKPIKADKLKLRGYAGAKLFGKTMYWNRAPDDLELCSKPGEKPVTTGAKTAPPAGAKKSTKSKKSALPKVINKNSAKRKPKPKPDSDTALAEPPPPPSADADNDDWSEEEESRPRARRDRAEVDRPRDDDRDYDRAAADRENCRLSLPYVELSFPCPEDD